MIDDFAEQNTILHSVIQGLAFRINGQKMFQISVVTQITVDPIREGELFLKSNRMCGPFTRCI